MTTIGRSTTKIDSYTKVTGKAKYADDLKLPRMAYGRILRSTEAHALLKRVDVARARALPGVLDVFTAADMPHTFGIMPTTQDEYPFALDKVRYVGEPIAAVCAVDEETAEEALSLIEVEYEPLPVITTIEDALAREDVKIHDYTKRGNIMKEVHLTFGDMDEGFAEADLVREDTFFFEGTTHAPMEEHACVADCAADGKITLWTSTQTPHYVHREIGRTLGVPLSRLRIIVPPVGGGFGGKCEPFAHDFAACLFALRHGRPVKFTLTREEVFYCHRGRHPVKMLLKTGVKQDGTITAVHLQTFLDGGAYASYGLATVYYTGALLTVTYKIPRYKFDGMRLYTNKPACGPKRGHGSTQPRYAFECQLDKIAEQLGLDPAAYRRQIAIEPYSTTVNGLRVTTCGLVECVDKVVAASDWERRRRHMPTGRGLGFAVSSYVTGAGKAIYWNDMPHSGVIVKIDRGGGVAVLCGSSDIGQGSDTMLAQVVAQELGVDILDIRVHAGDTDLTPVDLGSYSSRVTFMAGNAARAASQKLRALLFAAASELLGEPADALSAADGQIGVEGNATKSVSFVEAAQKAEATHGTLSAVGSYTPPQLGGGFKGAGVGISPAYSYTACVAEVSVDPETYDLRVEKLWVAHDCGRALNPVVVEGQIEGSAYMGFGEATLEESAFRKGLHKIPSLLDYKLPTIYDTPEIIALLVETNDQEGPYGAKEAGEGPLNPIIPAIANAVYAAIGARVDSTPITPDKIARALKDRNAPPKARDGRLRERPAPVPTHA
ncbi:MAG TPA: molybdopterin cofactor-binding domain-containing protein [Ktedonobacterales bacterium]|nr:molybdopterin cofactor-binding domain-containing protein [Ktedonobacterales bacterium]